MEYNTFTGIWNNQQVTKFGGDSVALIAEYMAENNYPIIWGSATTWINNSLLLSTFDWTTNKPEDFGQIPLQGDIVVWPKIHEHIAFFDHSLGNDQFISFGQGSGGIQAHFQQENLSQVSGWYTAKQVQAPQPVPEPTAEPEPPTYSSSSLEGARNAPSKPYGVIVKAITTYSTSSDAILKQNPKTTIGPANDYFLFSTRIGLNNVQVDNVTLASGQNQSNWIRTADNVEDAVVHAPISPQLTYEDVKKNWQDEPTQNLPQIRTITPETIQDYVDWKASYQLFRDVYGDPMPRYYRFLENYIIREIEKAGKVQKYEGDEMLMAGQLVGPDGLSYYRPAGAAELFKWFVVADNAVEPVEQLQEAKTAEGYLLTDQRPINPYNVTKVTELPFYFYDKLVSIGRGIMDIQITRKGNKK